MTIEETLEHSSRKMRLAANEKLSGLKLSTPHSYIDLVDREFDLQKKQIILTFTIQTTYASTKIVNISGYVSDLELAIKTASLNELKSLEGNPRLTVLPESIRVSEKALQEQYNEQQEYCVDVMHMSECEDEDDEYYAEKDIGVCFKHKVIFTMED